MDILDLDKLYLFIMFVVPGFISLKTYELLSPNQFKESSKQLIDAVTYSCFTYALLFFFILKVEQGGLKQSHSHYYFLFYFFVLFAFPVLLAFTWTWLRSKKWFQKFAPHPTYKAWDWVFAQRRPLWAKVILKDGTVIGGLYSNKSFASSAPAQEQIYLEETWIINENGGFERAKNRTAGVIILSSDISHIELRSINDNE